MHLVIGSDHAGLALKTALKSALAAWGHTVEDVGTHTTESCDYPLFAERVAEQVAAGREAGVLGLLVCGSGIGVSIAANKIAGVRAARCDEPYSAEMARRHNDANVLCLGERVVGAGLAERTLKAFVDTAFEGGRHARRVEQIAALERRERERST